MRLAGTSTYSTGKLYVLRQSIGNLLAKKQHRLWVFNERALVGFRHEAAHQVNGIAAAWLVGQCTVFVRHREQLANPPVSLASGEAAIEWLTALISAWALAGLTHAQTEASSSLS